MEFENQYLTYSEYVQLGGSIDEPPFNILELEARKLIDKYTFGRLKNLNEQIQEVKICIFNMISVLENQNKFSNQNKAISSESIDGYSVSYSKADINMLKANIEENKAIIKNYLSDCRLEDGTPYLYVGGVKW